MRNYSRHFAIAVAAALMLAVAVGSASAGRFSLTTQNIRVSWTPLRFVGSGGAPRVECNVVLEGSFHYRTFAKVVGSLIGLITRASIPVRPCAGGSAWIYNGVERNEALGNVVLAQTLPWHITYEGFLGALPEADPIVLLTGARFLIRATVFGITLLCNYTTGAANGNASGIVEVGAAGRISGLRADETRNIRSENGGCPAGHFQGIGAVTVLGTVNEVSVTLI